jgi:site-specific recombinase XerD
MEAAVASRSPVTLPGYRTGQTPANAGRTLPPEILTPNEARTLLRTPSLSVLINIRNPALLAVLYLRHITPVELVKTMRQQSWNSP